MSDRPSQQPGTKRGREGRGPGRESEAPGGGVLAEIVPLLRDGLVVLRTLIDLGIDRLDEIEEGRVAHVRRETYETILGVLDDEIARLESEEDSESAAAQVEVLRSLRNVLERHLRRTQEPHGDGKPEETGKKRGRSAARTRKVEID